MPSNLDPQQIEVNYLGRAFSIWPAEICKPYEALCTVTASERQQPSPENGWNTVYHQVKERTHWYDTDERTGREMFCAFSGHFAAVIADLEKRFPGRVVIHERTSSGLSDPDMTFLKAVKWRPLQARAVGCLLAHRGGQIICDVGFGKTFIIGKLARAYKDSKIVITVPIAKVAKDIYRDLRNDLPDVGLVGAGSRQLGHRITVAVTHSLKWAPLDANMLLVDEAHKVLTPNFIKALLKFRRAKLFAFTASPEGRGDNRDGYLDAVFGPVLCDVTYQENVDVGNVVPLEVIAYRNADGPEVAGISDDIKRFRLGYWRNDARNRAIAAAVREQFAELGDDTQLLIMVSKTEHALLLQQLLPDFAVASGGVDNKTRQRFLKEGVLLPDQTILTPKEVDKLADDFAHLRVRRAIATSVWSTGVNFWDLEVLVRADGEPSMIISGQIPGRLSRLAAKTDKKRGRVVDFTDQFSRVLQGRWEKRRATYVSKKWTLTYRDLPNDDRLQGS